MSSSATVSNRVLPGTRLPTKCTVLFGPVIFISNCHFSRGGTLISSGNDDDAQINHSVSIEISKKIQSTIATRLHHLTLVLLTP